MRIYGIDFTSAPKRDKPIVVAVTEQSGSTLDLQEFLEFHDWPAYERWLSTPGKWVAGFDFPFGLPEAFVTRHKLGTEWVELVERCAGKGKEWFRETAMQAFMSARKVSDKKRRTDETARSHSPLKTKVNPPVGLMYYEGAWRLRGAEAWLPGLKDGPPDRVGLEAYPGLLVSRLGERFYKNDKPTGSNQLREARQRIMEKLVDPDRELMNWIPCPVRLVGRGLDEQLLHPSGDWLDALLCAVQASWGYHRRDENFGLPRAFPRVEGWIVSA